MRIELRRESASATGVRGDAALAPAWLVCSRILTMPLPILQASTDPTPENLIRLFHRTELHWVRHVGEETQLEAGTAFTNPSLPTIWDANTILDAAVPPGTTAEQAVREVEDHYARQGLRCRQWIMNPSAPAPQTRPLVERLASRGWRANAF